jgi:hypothetical protein
MGRIVLTRRRASSFAKAISIRLRLGRSAADATPETIEMGEIAYIIC